MRFAWAVAFLAAFDQLPAFRYPLHFAAGRESRTSEHWLSTLATRQVLAYQPVFLTTYRGLSTAAAPRALALKRSTTSLLNSASLPMGACVTVMGQFSM